MPTIIPFAPSIPFQKFGLMLAGTQYIIRGRWNSREDRNRGAWIMDIHEEDETPIITGVKIVLGLPLGRRCKHSLFRRGIIVATDLSDLGQDARLDDLGTRVQVMRMTTAEVLSLRVTATFPDEVEELQAAANALEDD
jgi:hypothetical protein